MLVPGERQRADRCVMTMKRSALFVLSLVVLLPTSVNALTGSRIEGYQIRAEVEYQWPAVTKPITVNIPDDTTQPETAPPAPTTTPPPTTTPAPQISEDDIVALLTASYSFDERSSAVTSLQTVLGVSADGHYGNHTRNAHIAALHERGMDTAHVPPAPAPELVPPPVPEHAPTPDPSTIHHEDGEWDPNLPCDIDLDCVEERTKEHMLAAGDGVYMQFLPGVPALIAEHVTRERTYFRGRCNDPVTTINCVGFNWTYKRVFDMTTEPSADTIAALTDIICHGQAFNGSCTVEMFSGTDTEVWVDYIDYAPIPYWMVTLYQAGLAHYQHA